MSLLCPECHHRFEPADEAAAEAVCPACGTPFQVRREVTVDWMARDEPTLFHAIEVGQTVAHYRILEKLGGGGMGIVYKALDLRLGRGVALKFLPDKYVHDRQALERFRREARTTSALSHPHICTVYDVGEHEGRPFLVMELLEGQTLKNRLLDQPLGTDELLELALQIADALDAAHAQGVVHRDVKPANVFITRRGQVKVLDFGLAKLTEPAQRALTEVETLSSPGLVVGTVAYMSPEQARGQVVDPRSDLFSFGVVLYKMATGRLPFEGPTTAVVFEAMLGRGPVPPRQLNPALPADLEHVILKALEKDRDVRYQTAADLRADLKRLKRDTDSGRASAAGGIVPAAAPPRRRRWWAAGVGGLLLAGLLAGAALLGAVFRARPPAGPPGTSLNPVGSGGPAAAPRATPFLVGDAIRKQPAWSPAGNLIAYVSDESGKDDIWICDPSGANQLNVTATSRGANSHPAWSPDGQRIAFYSDADGGGIFTITALGGTPRKLAAVRPGILYAFSLHWAHNGELVYTDFDAAGEKQVYRLSESRRVPECLTAKRAGGAGHAGELSPSGNLLAFLSPEVHMTATLHVSDLRSGAVVVLEHGAGTPHWGPAGDRIFFLSRRDGPADLWVVEVDPRTGAKTGPARRLTGALDVVAFTFAPDGRRLLAVKAKSQSRIWSFPAKQERITELAAGRPLTPGGFEDVDPCPTPDGTAILFSSNRREGRDLWKLTLETAGLVRLTAGPGQKYSPHVSPDGRWVVFGIVDEKGQYLHLMRPDGSDLHPLDPRQAQRFRITESGKWSPDGSRLVCDLIPRDGPAGLAIAAIDPGSGTAREIHVLGVPGESPVWSPDGRFLVYEAVREGSWDLWIVAAEGRDPRRLTSDAGNERNPVWSPDGKFVYYVKDSRSIWRLPMDSSGKPAGAAQLWARFPKARIDRSALCFTKDQVLVSVTEEASDLWLVEFPQP
jgi:serine/threonine protein kinase/Tol biopolymer transport system component